MRKERAIIVGVERSGLPWPLEESLNELERLVETDGGVAVARVIQRLAKPVPKTYIGAGKAQEIAQMADGLSADLVVFDEELSPSQQANLERIMGDGIKVIDRTALILDIFAQHASTREGKLQVQLAQNEYLLPRLRGMWSHLVKEQTRGGIGSRFGQGESQLEVDRRIIRKRISTLNHELKLLERRRETQRKARQTSGVFRISLVGYTNAGKSTLLNALTGAQTYVQDELFATLDPTTRLLELPEGRRVTLTDTVGFIQKLPTMLIEAFKSTLAEVKQADLILLVVDASDPNATKQIRTVEEVLEGLEAHEIPRVVVLNKCDLLPIEQARGRALAIPDALTISAKEGKGIEALTYRIAQEASRHEKAITVLIPFANGRITQMVHERCRIVREEYVAEGLMATVLAGPKMQKVLVPFLLSDEHV